MKKYIIGISSYYHESTVCIILNDDILDFVKEEEVTRVKGDNKFPRHALEKIINKYQILESEIYAVVFYEKPFLSWASVTHHALSRPFHRWKIVLNQFQKFWTGSLSFSSDLSRIFNLSKNKIFYCPHHLSHALNGLYFSRDKSKKYLIFVFDGVGDGESLSIYRKENQNIITEKKYKYPNSLGLLYSTVTQYLGFNINSGESKVMGLASYGAPIHAKLIMREIINYNKEDLNLNDDWFAFSSNPEISYSKKFIEQFGEPGKSSDYSNLNDKNFERLANIASSFQHVLENIIKEIITKFINKTGIKNIVFSGGVGLNSKAMQEISENSGAKELTVPASPGDSGSAAGAAIYGYMLKNGFKFPKFSYLPGAKFIDSNNKNLFKELFSKVSDSNNAEKKIANLISKGNVIATFIGNREFGPRALGSRSLLCAGNQSAVIENLNINLKKRELFRPLAPMIRDDLLDKYFYKIDNSVHNLYWMGLTMRARQITKDEYPKAVHIDGTSRVQIINKNNIFYHKLFLEVEKLKIDILINTSFNVAGDPMVFDYVDCYTNMKRMDLKYLFTDDGIFEIR
jgi:carbamoyltransferase